MVILNSKNQPPPKPHMTIAPEANRTKVRLKVSLTLCGWLNMMFIIFFSAGALASVVAVTAVKISLEPVGAQAALQAQDIVVVAPSATALGQSTGAFVQSWLEYKRAPSTVALDKLVGLAQQRRAQLARTVSVNPAEILDNALPSSILQALPSGVGQWLERSVTLEGKLEVVHGDDFVHKTSSESYFLGSGTDHLALNFVEGHPAVITGSTVRVRGVQVDKSVVLAGAKSTGGFDVVQEVLPGHTVRKVAVIKIDFLDKSESFSADTARSVIFNDSHSSNKYFTEAGFGRLTFTGKIRSDGDVFGPYTIPYNLLNTCDVWTWEAAAVSAAAAAGNDMTGYNNIVIVTPGGSSCGYAGYGTIGGNPAYSWILGNGNLGFRVVTHELGHNLGADHSSSLRCTDGSGKQVTLGGTCTADEYGDEFDVMGDGGNTGLYNFTHFNNFQKGRVNWLDAVNTQTATATGRYYIAPIELHSTAVQSLRVPIPGSTNYYYLEYRQPYGFDSFDASSFVAKGVSVRVAPAYTTLAKPLLLDLTPGTAYGFIDSALPVGQTFIDAASGITVTPVSATSGVMAVDVTVTTPSTTCVHANPTVTISPSTQTQLPGQVLGYKLNITNKDSLACGSSTFSVAPTLPAGWATNLGTFSVPLAPLNSYYTELSPNLMVTSSATATPGTYTITETVINTSAPVFQDSTLANYVVPVPDSTPPTVVITAPANGAVLTSPGSVTIIASATDSESGVNDIGILIDGIQKYTCFTASCSYGWNLKNVTAGAHMISVRAYDKAFPTPHFTSTSVTVTVTKIEVSVPAS